MSDCATAQISHSMSEEESAYVRQRLLEYNVAHVSPDIRDVYEKVNLGVRDGAGNIVGGLLATRYWDCMRVDTLRVDEAFRGNDYGSGLLLHIEGIAEQRGCRFILVDTLSFQAAEFYPKFGYQVIGTVEDIHGGHSWYSFIKRLNPPI